MSDISDEDWTVDDWAAAEAIAPNGADLKRTPKPYAEAYLRKARAAIEALQALGWRKGDTAQSVSTWVMFDNHTFERLTASTPKEIIAQARKWAELEPGISLCPVAVLGPDGNKETRGRVGQMAFFDRPDTEEQLARWETAVTADLEVMKLLAKRATSKPEGKV